MELSTAISLIEPAVLRVAGQVWYDLGAGSGLFTHALADLLQLGKIIAVDQDLKAMSGIPTSIGKVDILRRETDFSTGFSMKDKPDGVLMANSLHFVKDKLPLLQSLASLIRPGGQLIVVEYEMRSPNLWVPHPIVVEELTKIAAEAGFQEIRKISMTASRFQKDGIYSAAMTVVR